MLGVSFNTILFNIGANVFGEYSYTFGTPLLFGGGESLLADLLIPSNAIDLFTERDKSQLSLGFSQLFGPRFRASQSLVFGEAAYIHIHDMPSKSELPLAAQGTIANRPPGEDGTPLADASSRGYRLGAQLTYTGLFGGLNLIPRLVWTHDVNGNTPAPLANFLEDKKSLTVGLSGQYLSQSLTADIRFTNFFGAGRDNFVNDRDFLSFNVRFTF